MYKINLQPGGETFWANEHQTVLSAALEAGITFPHRCQIGGCMSCLCRVKEGKVSYALEPMLSENERHQGWMFACLAYPQSHLVLQMD